MINYSKLVIAVRDLGNYTVKQYFQELGTLEEHLMRVSYFVDKKTME